MTEDGLDIQTKSTKRTEFKLAVFYNLDFQENGQNQPHKRHIWFCQTHEANASQNQKSRFFQPTAKHITFENF